MASDSGSENAYVKELQKLMRNVTKKLNATQRVDKIIEDNHTKSLDQLVALKLINPDQKAQALKKPALQAQLDQYADQLSQYKKFDAEYQDVMAKEREVLKAGHAKEVADAREEERAAVTEEMEQLVRGKLLTFGRFLKAAAARRQDESVEPDEEGRAFEGVLSNVYTGDLSAVDAIEKLIDGSEEKVRDFTGELNVTYARIKELSILEAPVADEDSYPSPSTSDDSFASQPETTTGATIDSTSPETSTDPTIAHATLSELQTQIPNGHSAPHDPDTATTNGPPTGSLPTDGGNAAGEAWDSKVPGEAGMEESFEMIPRDPQEVDEKEGNAPAPVTSTTSWADEAQDAAVLNGGDGFHEVTHAHKPRGGERGGDRGGRPRGRGFRGRGRGGRGGAARGARGD